MTSRINPWLAFGGTFNALIALLHVGIVLAGAPAYRAFGAGSLVPLLERGSWWPALITLGLATLFALWAAIAFSGAGLLPRLPLLRTGLGLIGALYTLRGLLLGPQIVLLARGRPMPGKAFLFSGLALAVGAAYLAGLASLLRARRKPPVPEA